MEGPYRDLGAGFARLAGTEGLRRTPASLRSVEDALFELLRNARDAGASNIYVASILKSRRYRSLTVIDDGVGIPDTHAHLIFEPGVTTRHLSPVQEPTPTTSSHGAGLSLHHIKQASVSAEVLSTSSPTAIRTVFDTRLTLPEKSLQSTSKPSGSNLPAVLSRFYDATAKTSQSPPNPPRLYHGSPAAILSRLQHNHIIQRNIKTSRDLRREAISLGLDVSLRTSQRVLAGEISPARVVEGLSKSKVAALGSRRRDGGGSGGVGGPILTLRDEEIEEILGVLRRVARASYLDLSGLDAEGRPGEIVIRARVYEPEEEYEDE